MKHVTEQQSILHYVTARDMSKISKAALENETFRKVACKANYYITKTNKDKHGKELWNHHKMVKRTMYVYDGVEGGKTGYTTKAGGTLVYDQDVKLWI